MTDDQKRRQRIELMLDLEKAEEDAKALRTALKSETDSLSAVAEWLDEASRSINVSQLSDEFFSRTMSQHVDIAQPRFSASLNFAHLVELRGQFISAQKRVEELAARNRELKAPA